MVTIKPISLTYFSAVVASFVALLLAPFIVDLQVYSAASCSVPAVLPLVDKAAEVFVYLENCVMKLILRFFIWPDMDL